MNRALINIYRLLGKFPEKTAVGGQPALPQGNPGHARSGEAPR